MGRNKCVARGGGVYDVIVPWTNRWLVATHEGGVDVMHSETAEIQITGQLKSSSRRYKRVYM